MNLYAQATYLEDGSEISGICGSSAPQICTINGYESSQASSNSSGLSRFRNLSTKRGRGSLVYGQNKKITSTDGESLSAFLSTQSGSLCLSVSTRSHRKCFSFLFGRGAKGATCSRRKFQLGIYSVEGKGQEYGLTICRGARPLRPSPPGNIRFDCIENSLQRFQYSLGDSCSRNWESTSTGSRPKCLQTITNSTISSRRSALSYFETYDCGTSIFWAISTWLIWARFLTSLRNNPRFSFSAWNSLRYRTDESANILSKVILKWVITYRSIFSTRSGIVQTGEGNV